MSALSGMTATVEEAFVEYRTLFEESLKYNPTAEFLDQYMMEVPMSGKSLQYNILRDYATLEEWIGERNLADIEGDEITLTLKKWDTGIRLERDDVEDAGGELYLRRAKNLGGTYWQKRNKLMADILLGNIDLGNGYDGVGLFSASHSVGNSGNQSNTGSLSLTDVNFNTTRTNMELFKDHKGEPLAVSPNVIMVGPSLRSTAEALFNAKTIGTDDNPLYKAVEIVVNPYLGSSGKWFLFDTTKDVKPIIFVDRYPGQKVRFDQITDETDSFVVMNDAFYWGIKARFNHAVGFALCVYQQGS